MRDESHDLALSLVRGDALLRAQRAIGLVPIEIPIKDLLLGLVETLA